MANDEFTIDPRTKFGAADVWEEDDEFAVFTDALDRGVTVSSDRLSAASDDGGETALDANALAQLRARLAAYR